MCWVGKCSEERRHAVVLLLLTRFTRLLDSQFAASVASSSRGAGTSVVARIAADKARRSKDRWPWLRGARPAGGPGPKALTLEGHAVSRRRTGSCPTITGSVDLVHFSVRSAGDQSDLVGTDP